MTTQWLPANADIRSIVAEELEPAGGKILDCWQDANRLFLRAVLPKIEEVRPKDGIKGGIALMACDGDICVHPYTFRLVCSNGAIMSRTLDTIRIQRVEFDPCQAAHVQAEIREAVRACAKPEVFARCTEQMRAAGNQAADMALLMASIFSRVPSQREETMLQLLMDIMQRFETGGDKTRFGLMNAVTSAARDQADPETRWRLEEIGGGVPVFKPAPVLSHSRALVGV